MKQKQCHEICFQDVENSWDQALPVGNGKLGAMVFFEDRVLHIAINHYDCYYRHLPRPAGMVHKGHDSHTDSPRMFQDPARFRDTYEELCKKTDRLRESGDTMYMHYSRMLHPDSNVKRPDYQGTSYPEGAELLLSPSQIPENGSFCLTLLIEEARIIFEAQYDGKSVKAEIIAARQPEGILLRLSQSERGLWKEPEWLSGTPVSGAFALCSPGFFAGANTFCLAATLLPEGRDPSLITRELLSRETEIVREHRIYWENFWRSRLSLPDAFLEHLWFLQLYLLECSSAKGSSYPEQSWGLSGLWDIRKPNM